MTPTPAMGRAAAGVANMIGIVFMRQQEMESRNLGRSVITLLHNNLSERARDAIGYHVS
jgi:hypothetical protein